MPGTIRLIDTQGEIRDVPTEAAANAITSGWRVPTTEEQLARTTAQASEEAYGGVGGAVKATLAAGARGATMGVSDALARAVGGDDTAIALEGLREENPGLSIGGEIAGALGPALVTGGASAAGTASTLGRIAAATPAGMAARLGARVAGAGSAGSTAAKLGYAAAGGAVEGAIQGAGSAVTELSLSTDPLTVERVAGSLSSGVLFGGVTGGAVGAAAKGLGMGLASAKRAIDGAVARKSVMETTPELAAMDARQLDAARKVEVEAIAAARVPEREAFAREIDALRQDMATAQLSRITSGVAEREVREAGKVLRGADSSLRKLTDNMVGLAEKPARALDPLRTQRQALGELRDWLGREVDGYPQRVEAAAAQIREELVAGKIDGYVPSALTEQGRDLAVRAELGRRLGVKFAEDGALVMPAHHGRLAEIDQAIARNEQLQGRLGSLTAEPASERIAQIDAAKEALAAPQRKSLTEHILGAATPFMGPTGAIASASMRVVGTLRKVAGEAARRTGQAVSAFLGVADKALPYAPVVATKALAAARYAPGGEREPRGGDTLAALFKARTDELKSQTAYDDAGVPRMRPEARAQVAERLRPVRAADPVLADRIETDAVRRIEYLSGLIPRRPDIMVHRFGPDTYRDSDMAMRSFARSVAAVEDPDAVFERAAHGAVTPEDIDALRAVAPEKLAEFNREVMARLPELRKSLPYARRLSLSLLTGVAVDPSMEPEVIASLQAQFTYDMKPPRAEPQFGSVSKRAEPGTASQRREEGAAV